MHLAGVTGLDDQPDLGPRLLAHQVVVHRGGEQQRGDRSPVGRRVAVREDDDVGAVGDGLRHPAPHLVDGAPQRLAAGGRGRTRQARLADVEEPVDGERLEAGRLPVLVDVHQLGQVVAIDDRQRQHDLAARALARLEQVGLGADGGRERRHQLLADGVERGVGHLGEELGEVVVEEAGAVGEDRDRRVRSHGAQRLHPCAGHGGEDQPQLLVGVAEEALLGDDAAVLGREHGPGRQLVEPDLVGRQPLHVGVLGGQLGLDLLVLDQPALRRVDQEHAARLQAALAHDALGGDVEHTHLAGQDHQPVVGDPVAGRPQAVAVEHRAHDGAVGEAHGRRTVPRLHERRVVAVEGAPVAVHRGVVLPRLGDHHEHRMGQRAATEVEQLEDLVEAGRVARAGRADRVDARQVAVDEGRLEQRLPGSHPVAVAGQRVDLAVVGHVAVGVRQWPARERVGGEARVHEGEPGFEAGVTQVGEELAQLLGRQHALVDDRPGRQRREVEVVDGVLRPLAHDEGAALQGHGVHARFHRGQEDLLDQRHGTARGRAQALGLCRHAAPPEHRQALLGRRLLHDGAGLQRVVGVSGQEGETDGVATGTGQREPRFLGRRRQEPVRDLDQDAGAVTRLDLGPGRAAVRQALEHGEAAVDDVVVGPAVQIGHHADTTGVVFVCRVVEARGHRRPSDMGEAKRYRDDVGPKVEETGYTTTLVGWAPCRRACTSSEVGSSAWPAHGNRHATVMM